MCELNVTLQNLAQANGASKVTLQYSTVLYSAYDCGLNIRFSHLFMKRDRAKLTSVYFNKIH
jgi:hypothetical protein